jgi:hypothetical protein
MSQGPCRQHMWTESSQHRTVGVLLEHDQDFLMAGGWHAGEWRGRYGAHTDGAAGLYSGACRHPHPDGIHQSVSAVAPHTHLDAHTCISVTVVYTPSVHSHIQAEILSLFGCAMPHVAMNKVALCTQQSPSCSLNKAQRCSSSSAP